MFSAITTRTFLLFSIVILSYSGIAQCEPLGVEEIIKKVEDNLNGKTAKMNISMKITTKRSTRTLEMESYSIGSEKSFIKITYPKKDKGITFLKVDKGMWQYVPKIEKIIKIPSSMMLQSWMGSDFTNDDLVRESSISEDYTTALLDSTEQVYRVELIPKDDAPVVWGKIIMEVSMDYFLPIKALYYDEEEELVRELRYEKIEQLKNRFYPTHWVMIPMHPGKKGHTTVVDISHAVFDEEMDNNLFTKRALKKYSR